MSENQTIIDRIKEYRDYKGGKKRDFEKKCGLANGYFNSTKKTPSADKLENILNAYPDLNRDWVIYGVGGMLIKSTPELKPYPFEESVNPMNATITLYTCSECVNKQKEINSKQNEIDAQKKTIEALEKNIELMGLCLEKLREKDSG